MKRKAIFLYDFTGLMAQPWIDAGYECWCFDGQHDQGITRDGNHIRVGMWFYADQIESHALEIAWLVGPGVEFVFGFPECTDLTNAGSGSWARKRLENPAFQDDAIQLAKLVPLIAEKCDCDCWGAENPVGMMSTLWRKPDFWFDPCDYGGYLPMGDEHPLYPEIYPGRDAYNKKTGIWKGPGFREPRRQKIEPLYKDNPGWKKCGGKSTRTKNIRSATPRGFTLATFEANSPLTRWSAGDTLAPMPIY
jgi:hypothetical protein